MGKSLNWIGRMGDFPARHVCLPKVTPLRNSKGFPWISREVSLHQGKIQFWALGKPSHVKVATAPIDWPWILIFSEHTVFPLKFTSLGAKLQRLGPSPSRLPRLAACEARLREPRSLGFLVWCGGGKCQIPSNSQRIIRFFRQNHWQMANIGIPILGWWNPLF